MLLEYSIRYSTEYSSSKNLNSPSPICTTIMLMIGLMICLSWGLLMRASNHCLLQHLAHVCGIRWQQSTISICWLSRAWPRPQSIERAACRLRAHNAESFYLYPLISPCGAAKKLNNSGLNWQYSSVVVVTVCNREISWLIRTWEKDTHWQSISSANLQHFNGQPRRMPRRNCQRLAATVGRSVWHWQCRAKHCLVGCILHGCRLLSAHPVARAVLRVFSPISAPKVVVSP